MLQQLAYGEGYGEDVEKVKSLYRTRRGKRERQIHDTETPINRKNETRKSGEKNANNGARRNV